MIKNVDFKQTIEEAFLKYGASIAQERSLPDVRDMLKIGLRQGLYAQFTNKLTHKDKFQKAQKVSGIPSEKKSPQPQEIVMKLFNLNLDQFLYFLVLLILFDLTILNF